MKYKNIIFDFGNVIGQFDEEYILSQFCTDSEDYKLLSSAIFENWQALDAGTIDYADNVEHTVSLVPPRLEPVVRDFFHRWDQYLTPLKQTWDFIRELKAQNIPIYILSNASVPFAEHAEQYEIVKEFDGIVFSAPIQMAKPHPEIYQYLFDTYHLVPEECFFIDDREDNIAAAKELGMDGVVFTGDIELVKSLIDF